MKDNFDRALKFTFRWEGIHSNDAADPGGDTKYGIARNFHPEITDEQWGNFTIQDAADIYKNQYWDALNCDQLAYPLDCAVFDAAVNPGQGAAKRMRGQCKGFHDFMELRRQYYRDRVKEKPEKAKYLKGWFARCDDLEKTFGGAA